MASEIVTPVHPNILAVFDLTPSQAEAYVYENLRTQAQYIYTLPAPRLLTIDLGIIRLEVNHLAKDDLPRSFEAELQKRLARRALDKENEKDIEVINQRMRVFFDAYGRRALQTDDWRTAIEAFGVSGEHLETNQEILELFTAAAQRLQESDPEIKAKIAQAIQLKIRRQTTSS